MKYLVVFITCLTLQTATAQQTIGLFENDSLSYNGYTLMSPMGTIMTYLLDNCGQVVNTWQCTGFPTFSAYLLEDGSLLRPARQPGTQPVIERYSWEGDLLWSYSYTEGGIGQHHDIKPMPNGNILVLAGEEISNAAAIEAGRDSMKLDAMLWLEHIVELQPIGTDSAAVVWEWHVLDHLVQEYDATKANYGVVADHPERLDFNFVFAAVPGSYTDWLHANYIDYNPALDQVIINFRNLSEFWIIDHSTTTAEAAGSTGGNSGKGGDILYRWGNPQVYQRGTVADQKLYLQHNSHWIPADRPGTGNVLIFNNGNTRPAGQFSTVEEIVLPVDEFGNYETLAPGQAYGPATQEWIYEDGLGFYSLRISGTERQPNGNTLICDGFSGRLFEVENNGTIHWDYINPIANGAPLSQGDSPFGNSIFTIRRYSPDYPGLVDKDLTPGDVLELNPLPSTCEIYEEGMVGINNAPFGEYGLTAYPIPANEMIRIAYDTDKLPMDAQLEVLNHLGQPILYKKLLYNNKYIEINVKNWLPGLYFYRIKADRPSRLRKLLVLGG